MDLTGSERDRLIRLIREHRLEPSEDELLAHSAPCVTLLLSDIEDPRRAVTDSAPGSSRMGGLPDGPDGFEWRVIRPRPDAPEVHAGFLMQLDLADLPRLAGSGLPATGLLSVFHWDQCTELGHSFEVHYFAATGRPWHRIEPPADVPCASELGLYLDGRAFPIEGVLGIDAPSKGQHDLLSYDAHERFAHESQDTDHPQRWASRWATFRQRAAAPGFDTRCARGFRYDWWWVGQLLGRMDLASAEWFAARERSAHRRRLLLQFETNPVVGFAGGCDAAPVLVLVLARDPGSSQHLDFGSVLATLAP